ncbi:MAG: FUN14 domain-containing protein [Gammaproteobacteria bacterium]
MSNTTIEAAAPSGDFLSSSFLLGDVGAPFVIGLAVGYFAKKMLRLALILGGGTVVLMFIGEYYGIIHITDAELQSAAHAATSAAKESGDFLVSRVSSITSRGISGSAGFFVGFKIG